MAFISNLTDPGDYCCLLVLIGILYVIGIKVTQGQSVLHIWGFRIATAVFVICAIANLLRAQSPTAKDLLWAVVSALFAAGLALGPAWIILAIGNFFYTNGKEARQERRKRADERNRQIQEEQERKREAERQRREFERTAPDREQALRDAEALRRRQEEDARLRQDARVNC